MIVCDAYFFRSAIQKLLAPYGLREINDTRGVIRYIRFDNEEAAMKVMGAVNIHGLKVAERFWRRPSGEGSSGASLMRRTAPASNVGASSVTSRFISNVRPTPVSNSKPTPPLLPAVRPALLASVKSTPSTAAARMVPTKPVAAPYVSKLQLMYSARSNPKIATR